MGSELGHLTIDEAAAVCVGNWQRFDAYAWHDEDAHDCPESWAILYTHNRDSGLLDQSNAAAIAAEMESFTTGENDGGEITATEEHAGHWACGWVDGYAVRVYDEAGVITEAFRTYHALMARLASYPVLDEEDYSRREMEATGDNVAEAVASVGRSIGGLPDDDSIAGKVHEWLSDNDPGAIADDGQDQGGYPSDDEVTAALVALGYLHDADSWRDRVAELMALEVWTEDTVDELSRMVEQSDRIGLYEDSDEVMAVDTLVREWNRIGKADSLVG